jgi:hypothetical protein
MCTKHSPAESLNRLDVFRVATNDVRSYFDAFVLKVMTKLFPEFQETFKVSSLSPHLLPVSSTTVKFAGISYKTDFVELSMISKIKHSDFFAYYQ